MANNVSYDQLFVFSSLESKLVDSILTVTCFFFAGDFDRWSWNLAVKITRLGLQEYTRDE